MTSPWQLFATWGFLDGIGSGAGAVGIATAIANRWFAARNGLVMGLLFAANAAGQLVFLPLLALIASHFGWQGVSMRLGSNRERLRHAGPAGVGSRSTRRAQVGVLESEAAGPSPKLRCARRLSITTPPRAPRCSVLRAQQRVIELADRFNRFLQLVVIAQPAPHLVDLLAPQAELARAPAGIADRQNPQRVSATAGADRTAAAVTHRPLDQRTAQHFPGHR
jgi:hypothetical protein